MNPANGQSSLDYLNEISPDMPQKKGLGFGLNLKTVLLVAVVVVILGIILATLSGAIKDSQLKPWRQFSAKLQSTSKIVEDSSKNLKNSQLRSLNTDLKLSLANTQRDIAKPLESSGIDSTKLPAEITAAETNSGITERLEDGRLNAKFDSTYTREMTYQLAQMLTLLQQMYATTKSPETQKILTTAYNNLNSTYTKLSEFSADNE